MDPQTAVKLLRENMGETEIAHAVGTHQTTINRIFRGEHEAKWKMGNALIELAKKRRTRKVRSHEPD